jgi:hypothetical protein
MDLSFARPAPHKTDEGCPAADEQGNMEPVASLKASGGIDETQPD